MRKHFSCFLLFFYKITHTNSGDFMKRKIIFLLSIIIISISSILFIKYGKMFSIRKYYGKSVVVTRNSKLYSSSFKEVGNVSKGVFLNLDKLSNSLYFKIKGTDYYIYYENVKREEKAEAYLKDYLPFDKNIKTNKNVVLKKEGKDALKIDNGVSLPIKYVGTDYYYVSFLGDEYQVNKNDGVIEGSKNTNEEEASFISVLYFNNASSSKIKEVLSYLKDNKYESISLDEYKGWLEGSIRLKKKTVLLTTSENIDNNLLKKYKFNIENVSNNSVFTFIDSNIKTTKDTNIDSINRYVVSDYTSLDMIEKMINGVNINESNNQSVAVLNYHFFYDSNSEVCNESICLDSKKFEQHLAYLKENGYKALTMNEFIGWKNDKTDIPEKSVLITIDDGAMGTGKLNGNKLIPLLEKYKMHATLFLITAWWNKEDYKSDYLEVESHGDDLHIVGECGKNKIYCLSGEDIFNDLNTSINKLGTKKAFCYPFYSYSDSAIEQIKKAGFSVAFVGGNRKVTREDDSYLIPRYPIQKDISMEEFIKIIS